VGLRWKKIYGWPRMQQAGVGGCTHVQQMVIGEYDTQQRDIIGHIYVRST
jgi:hypothetical protein